MGLLAQSIRRTVRYFKQSALGSVAATSDTAIIARRASTSLQHTKNTFASAEKRASGQQANEGHGQNMVAGDIVSELYSGAWADVFGSVLQQNMAAVSVITASSGDGFTIASNVLTRAAGGAQSFVSGGIKVGQVVRLGAIATAADVGRNLLVTAVTATTVTLLPLDGVALTDIGSADTDATLTVVGKRSFIPQSGHTDDYYTIEDNNGDIDISELFTDVKFGRMAVSLSPNQPVQLTFGAVGTGGQQSLSGASAPYFTSPAAVGNTEMFTSIRAYLVVNGILIGIATGFNITIDRKLQAPEVIAATRSPEVFVGAIADVSGSFTVFYKDNSLKTLFATETEAPVALVLEGVGSPKAFVSFFMPRCKINSATRDDPDTGIVQTVNIRALEKPSTTGYDATTITIQDSAAA